MKNIFKGIGLYASAFLVSANLFGGNPSSPINEIPLITKKVNFEEFVSKKGFSDVKEAHFDKGIMYFQKGKGSKADIYSYDFNKKDLLNLTADNPKGFDGDFDIKEDKIYFIRENKENFGDIYCMNLETKKLSKLTKGGFNEDISLNSFGNKLLYIHKGEKSDDIFELDLKTEKSKQITNSPNLDEKNPRYSKDGNLIFYLWDDSEMPIQVENTKTGKLEQILIKKGYDDEYLSAELTDKKILYQHLTSSGKIKLESKSFDNLEDVKAKPNVYSGSFWEASKLQVSDNGYFAYLGQTDQSLRIIFGQEDILKTSSKMLKDFKLDKTYFVLSEDGKKVYVLSGEKIKVIQNPLIK